MVRARDKIQVSDKGDWNPIISATLLSPRVCIHTKLELGTRAGVKPRKLDV